jgi:iron-sulfur cluster repair protein YtfE (RIC family)
LAKKAISTHKRLVRLFNATDDILKPLRLIEEELEKHIRFEERILFNELQKVATKKQLETILKLHTNEKFSDNTNDPFWE